METTNSCLVSNLESMDFGVIPNGSFRISYSDKKSKTVDLFDELYTYPPKFRVKWDTIDELHEDLFMSYNYRVLNKGSSFLDALNSFFKNDEDGTIKKTHYSPGSYLNGYLNKVTATRFYGKQAKKFQNILQNIPVYTILNGQGEIVLANSTDVVNSNPPTLNKTVYELCGNFDPLVETNTQLGMFFMSKTDAEVYLNGIAKSDTQGTKMLGLSIHCVGLDFAYRVMREYNPNIDFRFVPDLNEVQTLLNPKTIENPNLVFENGQQQLRLRPRKISVLSKIGVFTKGLFPFSSSLEKVDYFKGVPIYIVKVNTLPSSFFAETYYNTINIVDAFAARLFKVIRMGVGFRNNMIIEGSINHQSDVPTTKSYIFFEKTSAINFSKSYSRQIRRYSGSQLKLLEPFTKQPKIFVYNLEDLLETLEDKATNENSMTEFVNNIPLLDLDSITLIPTQHSKLDVDGYLQQNKKSPLGQLVKFFEFKCRRLGGFLEILLNTN